MPFASERTPSIGYVVSTWPRLSQTFVLNEILALEQRGVRVQIFSTKNPGGEPVHAKLAQVRAPVAYLTFRHRGRAILLANVRVARRRPGAYARGLLRAMRFGRTAVVKRFFQAGYLADCLGREPVTHLHAHFATGPAQVAMLAHDLVGVPYSFTAHARDIFVDTPPALLRAEMERARAVITVSEYNRRHLASLSRKLNGKVHCIACGLDLSEFTFRWPRATDAPPLVILAVARLVEKKGLGNLIAAAALLRAQGLSFRVEIIGEGPLRPNLEAAVTACGLADTVTLRGAQPHEVVRAAYGHASIFVLPCVVAEDGDRDGLPVVLLEAMASGLPVVTTPVVGIPELIQTGRHGLLVPEQDPRTLARALRRLLLDARLRDRFARAARTRIEERFSIDRSADRLLTIFRAARREDVACIRP
jgi:glycosyltransferase involved in cell wall biosynthesis